MSSLQCFSQFPKRQPLHGGRPTQGRKLAKPAGVRAGPSLPSRSDEQLMELALQQARKAASKGEVPVGAVLVSGEQEVLASCHNQTESLASPLAHAELLCLQSAASQLSAWRLASCTLYVTLEPCPMCAGAILSSRLKRVVYGARQPQIGADGSWVSLFPLDDVMAQAQQQAGARGSRGKPGMVQFQQEPAAGGRKQRQRQRQQQAREGGQHSQAPQEVPDPAGRGQASIAPKSTPSGLAANAAAAAAGGLSLSAGAGLTGRDPAVNEYVRQQQPFVHSGVPFERHAFHPDLQVTRGVLEQACAQVLQDFFRARREQQQQASTT